MAMTISELNKLLSEISKNRFILDATKLNIESVSQLFDDYLPNSTLIIQNPVARVDKLTISGQIALGNVQNAKTDVRFLINDIKTEVTGIVIEVTLPSWELKTTFVKFSGNSLAKVGLKEPRLVLRSHENDKAILSAKLQINTSTGSKTATLTAQIPSDSRSQLAISHNFVFREDFDNYTINNLAALTQFVSRGKFNIPSEIPVVSILNLKQLKLTIDPIRDEIIALDITVQSPSKLTIIEGFEASEFLFSFIVYFSDKSQDIYTTIATTLNIHGQKINVALPLSDHLFLQGELAHDTPIPLKPFISKFIPSEIINIIPDEFQISGISVGINLSQSKNYVFDIELSNIWAIDFASRKLNFKRLALEVEGTASNLSHVAINGELDFAGTTLYLAAQYQERAWKFEGRTGDNSDIKIEQLIEEFEKQFKLKLPSPIESIDLKNLHVSFSPQNKEYNFICRGYLTTHVASVNALTLPNTNLTFQDKQQNINIVNGHFIQSSNAEESTRTEVVVNINTNQDKLSEKIGDTNYNFEFSGKILIGSQIFNLLFNVEDKASKILMAICTYEKEDIPTQSIFINELIEKISPNFAEVIPSIQIDLKDILFIFDTQNDKRRFAFGFTLGTSINLSNLPLVSGESTLNRAIIIDNLQILIASEKFTLDVVHILNSLNHTNVTKLPEKELDKGFNISALIKFGSSTEILSLPVADNSKQITTPPTTTILTDDNVPASDSTKWFKLQKSFGPVHFERVGVKYQNQEIWFLLDAALSAGGLTLSLDALSVSSPLKNFKPSFHLSGIGIDYRSQSVEIGGAFLRKQFKQDGKPLDENEYEYDGAAILRTQTKGKKLTFSALGSYICYKDKPSSLFLYALLDFPLGGPPFLFVTGLAAGFGYNRTLRLPDKVEDVAQFPLVKMATGDAGEITEITQVLEKLSSYIPPATGELFFAVGIKFTSFKIIDSFALLTVQLGNRSEINVLGLSTLIAPPAETGVEPIAKAQLAFRATYLPEEGFLKVEATLLPGAYLFSGNCHLSGGFAFYSWFSGEHEGDFVLTLGAYHPDFNIPEHYPKLPRLQLNWQLDSKTSIKGDAYFALCSHTLMAGGHLELTYQSGDLKAWLKAEADFLIAWKPYHYDAHIYVTIGASYTYHFFGTHHITAEVGADLHLWGPDFGGTATIHIWVVQINIDFGSPSSQQPNPIDWKTFKTSFLPKDEEVCSIAIQDGLVRKVGDNKSDIGVINPKHFSLVTNSAIPSKYAYKQEASSEREIKVNETNTNLGIASMAVLSDDLKTEHIITITRNGQNVEEEFQYIPILKKVPTGLWGQPPSSDKPLTPSVNGQQFIENVLSGFEIKPNKTHKPGETQAVDRANLQYEPESAANGYFWEPQIPFQADSSGDSNRRDRIRATVTKNSRRENLLKSLGFDPDRDVELSEAIADDFIITPQIKVY